MTSERGEQFDVYNHDPERQRRDRAERSERAVGGVRGEALDETGPGAAEPWGVDEEGAGRQRGARAGRSEERANAARGPGRSAGFNKRALRGYYSVGTAGSMFVQITT